jgi:hypothetical protein
METIGKLLKRLRLERGLSLEDISFETRITPTLLAYLEEDNFQKLPVSAYTKGFITSYASVVGLHSDKALAVFRRDFTVSESGKILPKGLSHPLDKPTIVTSKVATSAGIVLFILVFFGYLAFQVKGYNSAPKITIVKPKAHTEVKGPGISIRGFVTADSTVYVNGAVVEVYPTGEFRAVADLPPGEHTISIKAVNSQQKSTDATIPLTVITH